MKSDLCIMRGTIIFFLIIFLWCLGGCGSGRYINPKVKIKLSGSSDVADVYDNISKNDFLNAITILERKRSRTLLRGGIGKKGNYDSSIIPLLKNRGIVLKKRDRKYLKTFEQNFNDLKINLGTSEPDIIQFQNQLNDETVAISYVVLKNSYGAFLIKNDSINFFDFCIPKDVIDKAILDVKYRLVNPYNSNGRMAKRDEKLYQELYSLYKALFLPIEKNIAGKKNLIVVPAGNLQLIPIQAMVSNTKKPSYLIEDYNFIYASSLTYLKESIGRSRHTFKLLLYGDPVNSVLTGADKMPRIPHAGKEARIAHSILPESDLFLGKSATEKNLKESINKYSVVHLATHGYVDSINPQASFLLTADDKGGKENGIFTVSEILETQINAELVILSACETAIGSGPLPDNNALGSMAMAFMSSGADSVISSLWSVDDVTTAKLMTDFYKYYGDKSIGQNFRDAQLELLRNDNYSHPYFWAPFILYGSYL